MADGPIAEESETTFFRFSLFRVPLPFKDTLNIQKRSTTDVKCVPVVHK